MSKCDWCGKELPNPIPYTGGFFGNKSYCSKRCKIEAENAESSKTNSSSSDIDNSRNSGCLIITIIKWIIIILVALFLLMYLVGKS